MTLKGRRFNGLCRRATTVGRCVMCGISRGGSHLDQNNVEGRKPCGGESEEGYIMREGIYIPKNFLKSVRNKDHPRYFRARHVSLGNSALLVHEDS